MRQHPTNPTPDQIAAEIEVELEVAIGLAADIHAGQKDRQGEPYILHPLRVMLSMDSPVDRVVAVLHDVAEDSDVGWQELHDAGFSEEVLDAIDALSRREAEPYEAYIERLSGNAIARRVKLADLSDNTSPSRSAGLTPKLAARYSAAIRALANQEPKP